MKNTIFFLYIITFTLAGCIGSPPKEIIGNDIKNNELNFLVWYDGWGGLTIWGIGFTTSPSVKCGDKEILFYTTYDTHTRFFEETYPNRKYPKDKTFAKNYNLELLKYFKATGNECDFSEILKEQA
ncbi:hypothetical protein [Kangiella taiwanensis]|uniref:Lipoprotein n=1 Tax=Kangiella taiwanensis TaxID=1079179 RepID=A0ABP8I254_9GAMM|nr:hypothetical protein [Kangiella taiwanensis]